MNAKKLTSLLLVCVLVMALLLAGCNTPVDNDDNADSTTTTTTATNGDNGDTNDTTTTEGGTDDTTTTVEGDTTTTVEGDTTTTVNGDTTTKKTTTSTQKTTLSKVYTEPQMPSFERLDDGTYKDRKTGVIFIDDDCNILPAYDKETGKLVANGTKLYDANKIQIDSNQKEFFGNDGARFIRAVDYDGLGCYATYKLTSGITDVAIDAFTGETGDGTGIYNGLELYVSKNGKSGWTKVELKYNAKNDTSIGSGWTLRRYTATNIGDGYKYAKITWKDDWSSKKVPIYTPNVSRIRINNIDKMDETDRFLEGRVSKTFYVDSKKGDDKNDGTSPEKAWKTIARANQGFYQPGDKLLFKSGDSFVGNLKITGYGTANDRFVVGTYGGDAKAKLTSRSDGGDVANISCAYTTIENLDISGKNAKVGLKVGASQSGAVKGVIVQNCYVHDVQVDDGQFVYSTGGIQINATGTKPTWFEGAVIRNNTVESVSRVGIYMTGAWGDRPGASWGASGELYKNDNDGWWPNTNCVIANNTLTDVHGDAVLVISAKDTIIENNYANDNFTIGNDKTKLKYCQTNGFSQACATIWVCNTNGSVMQNNEVGYTHLDAGWVDGEAFDIDGANREAYVQYNYTHDNVGGSVLLCDFESSYSFTTNTFHIIRFNLSIDDGWAGGHGSIVAAWTRSKVEIYNNTFVQRTSSWPLANIFDECHNYTFRNNIFYGEGAGTIAGAGKLVNFVMDNNVYAGGAVTAAKSGLTVKNIVNQNPKFKNADFTHGVKDPANRKGAIAAFTPTVKIAGATSIKDNGGKDINGTKITDTNFYGCIKY